MVYQSRPKKRRGAADLTQTHEERQHTHACLSRRMVGNFFNKGLVTEVELRMVNTAFFFAELGIENGINFIRQLGEHIVFDTA